MNMQDIINGMITPDKLKHNFERHDISTYDSAGFVLIDPRDPNMLYQCNQCFGVIFPFTPTPFPPVDPFEQHRKNCYGWNRTT